MIALLGGRRAEELPGRRLYLPNEIPDKVPEDWAREFEAEKARVERYRYRMTTPSAGSWVGLLNSGQSTTGPTYTGTAITDVSPAPDFTLPGGFQAGTVLRLTALGQIITSTSAPTVTFQFMYSGTGGTSLYSNGGVAMSTSVTNNFCVEAVVRILTAGTGGTFTSWGRQQGISTTANIGVPVQVTQTSTAINTTTGGTLICAATSSAAITSLIVYTFLIEQLN